MSRKKKMLFMLLGLVILICLLITAKNLTPENEAVPSESPESTALALNPDTVTAFTDSYNGTDLTFKLDGDSWRYAGDEGFPADQTKIESMLSALSGVTAQTTIAAPEDTAQYGFDDPQCTIRLTTESGDTVVYLGDYNDFSSQYYLMVEGDKTVYLVDSAIHDRFCVSLLDLVQFEAIPGVGSLSAITVTGGDVVTKLENLPKAEGSAAADAADPSESASAEASASETVTTAWYVNGEESDKAADLVSALSGLSFTSCADYNCADDQLAAYGLDDTAKAFEVAGSDGSYTLLIGAVDGESAYARFEGSKMVYLISTDIIEAYNALTAS